MRFGPVALAVLVSACGGVEFNAQNAGATAASGGAPVQQDAPNAPSQQPAFAGQTRAPAVASGFAVQTQVVASGLEQPWAVEVLPDGRLLVTEQAGRLRIVTAAGAKGEPIAGLPPVDYRGQGGLLDVALSPTFGTDRQIYWTYSEPREGGNGTAVARGRLSADDSRVENVQVIWRMRPTYDGDKHFGSRLVFAPDGHLFVTTGERSDRPGRVQARKVDSHFGKIVRIRPDGTAAGSVTTAGALPDIWSIGHRNLQSAALDPQGRLWTVEHGPRGGDELNRPEGGKDYGWPDATYGIEYSGGAVGAGTTQVAGTEQPVYYWDPVIGPSGMVFYQGALFPEWRGNALVGGLRSKDLVRLVMQNDRVVGEERLLTDKNWRVRDLAVDAAGAIWIVTDEQSGNLVKVSRGG